MAVTLAQLLSETTEVTRNSTTGALDNTKRTRAINRVLEDLQDFADWKFTRRTKKFDYIDGVSEYSLQNYIEATMLDNDGSTTIADFKNPFELRVPGSYASKFVFKETPEVRDAIRDGKNVNWYGEVNDLLLISYPRQVSALLHDCDSLTSNGTVAASGDATNLTIDDQIFDQGSGALNFDVSSGTSLVITFTGINAKDLTEFQNKSYLTLKAWLPTITNFSSIKLEWGDDASNNWSKTETLPAGNRELETGKNLFAFSWKNATEVGSPDVASINFLRVTITFSSAITDTDFRLDDIRIGQAVEMELDYYSQAMVKNSSGTYQLEFNPTDVTQGDKLLGDVTARRTIVEGTKHELFEIIGGKSERDRTDSFNKYDKKRVELRKRAGSRIRRPGKVLNFPKRR